MRLNADEASIARAAEALIRGEIVAFPTETVYGLGARADDSASVRRIYEKKGRPAENPSIVHCLTADAALALAANVGDRERELARAFWPGPLTLVLPVSPGSVAPEVTAGGSTIAVRVPAHPVARALLAASGLPIAAPSANRSTRISPTTADHVEKSLGTDFILIDAGPTGFGIESTIVDATAERLVVLRRGSVTVAELAGFGEVIDVGDEIVSASERPRAPGSFARHYAPRVPVILAGRTSLSEEAAQSASTLNAGVEHVGLIVLDGPTAELRGHVRTEVLPRDPVAYARGLYAALHRLEDAGAIAIVVERVPAAPAWAAVRDRLTRASR